MFLYVLAIGSPTHAIDPAAWDRFCSEYTWAGFYGYEHVNFGPLFGHQYAACWIGARGLADAYLREKGTDYFENSRRATLAQRAYAIDDPNGWRGYGPDVWGLTACDGPGDGMQMHRLPDGSQETRRFQSYLARGASAKRDARRRHDCPNCHRRLGPNAGWFNDDYLSIDQGPILPMAENHLTGRVWKVMRGCEPIRSGLRLSGFTSD